MRAINVTDFEAVVEETGALILDTRKRNFIKDLFHNP
jgi:hypothetical protein